MIYADLNYSGEYYDKHDELVAYLMEHFETLQHGHQCDSWIWIFSGDDKVAIDSFSSMQHQVKSESNNHAFIAKVLDIIAQRYTFTIYSEPELEPHEEI